MEQEQPYRIMTFRDFVPDRMRFVLLLLFAFAFQFSGGVYLSALSQMASGKALMEEDIMMAAYMSFIGLTVTFPLVFRIKFRFRSRDILLAVAGGIALCNVATMATGSLPVLMAASFVSGALKLIGTFECMSTLQLKITPTRNQTVFFCVLFPLILTAIQLSGLTTVYMDYFFSWRYMHVAVSGVMVAVMLCVFFLMKDSRLSRKLPLYGIDWTGLLLWTLFLVSGSFTLQYGKHFEWFDSGYIRIGIVVCIASLATATAHMLTARRPYFDPEIFSYRNFIPGLALLFAMDVLLASPNAVQGALLGGILHFDSLTAISLNWAVLAGVAVGAAVSWYALVVSGVSYKPVILLGFACLTAYQVMMYFLIDPRTNIEAFYAPSFLRGIGYVVLYVVLTIYPTEHIPFQYFLQPIGLLGFIRTGIGTVAASSIVSNLLNGLNRKNGTLIGAGADLLNERAVSLETGALYGETSRQALLVSLKELLGWFSIGGIILLALILAMPYIRPILRTVPKMKTFRRYIRRKYRMEKALPE